MTSTTLTGALSPNRSPFSPRAPPDLSSCCVRWLERPPTQRVRHACLRARTATPEARAPLTSALEEVAVHILYGGVDGGPSGDTSRSDIGVILRIYILKSFPGDSRMEFWKIPNKTKIKT